MDLPGRDRGVTLALASVASIALVIGVIAALAGASSAGTLGYDFLAYRSAAARFLEGRPLYDLAFQSAGGSGLFYYPPTFALAAIPFALIPEAVAIGVWEVLLVGAFGIGAAILPVSLRVRWLIVLLAALDWPFLYALKLGQVGPLLFLTFGIGWRWLDRPVALGASGALGAAIKLQPAIVLAWAFAVGRLRAVAAGLGILAVALLLTTAVAGIRVWDDYRLLLQQVSDPVTTPHDFTPGAVAFQGGIGLSTARSIQYLSWAAVLVAIVVGIRFASAEASYLSVVVGRQLLSPVLWDHYAMLLLLPVAWLLERRRWWAAAIPIVTSIFLVGVTPPFLYPLLFGLVLVAVVVDGIGVRRRPVQSAVAMTAA